ncbi:MAG: hypothetical protein GY751_15030 [Bacteroidetes bacterium]|nr:hypothetical protein [Bacteroidota bacterium]
MSAYNTLLNSFINNNKPPLKVCKFVLLDLDKTLVKTFEGTIEQEFIDILHKRDYESDAIYDMEHEVERWTVRGMKRPFFKEFLKYLSDNFEGVCVWSAGTKDYVEMIVDMLFKDLDKPLIVYSRDMCSVDDDNNYYKDLSKVYNDPILKGRANERNTIIVDDNLFTCSHNEFNSIYISKYNPSKRAKREDRKLTRDDIKQTDDTLLIVMWYMMRPEFLWSDDVRGLEKPCLRS